MDRAGRFKGGLGEVGEAGPHRDFQRLPVVLVEGGREEERFSCVRQLIAELTQLGLTGVFLRRGVEVSHHGLAHLAGRYDLVIVNGSDNPSLPIAWRGWDGGELWPSRPLSFDELGWDEWVGSLLASLEECRRRTPVWACILIGGKSSRMGRPKHLISDDLGKTWLERAFAVLRPLVDGLVVSGGGILPPGFENIPRLLDLPGVSGPLTGIVAAMRWQPLVSWLMVACDMPKVTEKAVQWLLADRPLGCWGRVPKKSGSDRLEPLFAWYDFRAGHLFEEQVHAGNWRLGEAAAHSRFEHPPIPEELAAAWANVNTPEQLASLSASEGGAKTLNPR